MSRIAAKSDQAVVVKDCRSQPQRSLTLQVLTGGISVYFCSGPQGGSTLEANRLSDGTPQNGFRLDSTMLPIIIPDFGDVMYALAAGPGTGAKVAEVEASDAAITGDTPKKFRKPVTTRQFISIASKYRAKQQ